MTECQAKGRAGHRESDIRLALTDAACVTDTRAEADLDHLAAHRDHRPADSSPFQGHSQDNTKDRLGWLKTA